jgi:hypothetical protein
MSETAQARRKETRKRGRITELEARLDAEGWRRYDVWQRACEYTGLGVNDSSRFEFLSDLVEFTKAAA